MKENVLHFIWENGLFDKQKLKTENGESVRIIHAGTLNTDSGPDFFHAKIQINQIVLVGNIELHIDGKDWYKHAHHLDEAYKNVILHVVFHSPQKTIVKGLEIPTLVIGDVLEKKFWHTYQKLSLQNKAFPCASQIENVPASVIQAQWDIAAWKRLEEKAEHFNVLYNLAGNRIDHAFIIQLFRSFGGGINNEAAQMLGMRLPMRLIYRYMHSRFQLEALILGMSGLLAKESEDAYFIELEKEFRYMKNQFQLQELKTAMWKFSKTRPWNFPTIRLAQLAALLHKNPRIIQEIFRAESRKELENIFDCELSPYWQNHFSPGKKSKVKQDQISKDFKKQIIINAVIPLIVWDAIQHQKSELIHKAMDLLQSLPFENNKVSRIFSTDSIPKNNALDSQAGYHQLHRFCHKKLCLQCKVGAHILRSDSEESAEIQQSQEENKNLIKT